DHLLLRGGERSHLLEETLHRRRMTILLHERIQRLHQVPARRVHLGLIARVHVVGWAAPPFLAARDELELHDTFGAQADLNTAIALLCRLGHEDAAALLELG